MTLTEFKAFQKGSVMKKIDELENLHTLAFQTALAQSHDKHGKPIYKNFKDMFDRKKYENAMLGSVKGNGKPKVKEETIENFKQSKEYAESLLNGVRTSESR